ncbi:MAG: glycosyltransferase [candidate division Zixibacteria bacterium]|nr:glycosyltransferase [candidate division Zixibacteria bacterium]
MSKLKVLHVYKDYFPVVGGIENHIRLLCAELAKDENFQIEVLVTNQSFKTVIVKEGNVRIVKTACLGKFASTPLSLSLFNWALKLKPDLVHVHFPYPLGELAVLLRGNVSKIILTYHSDIVKQKRLLWLYRPFLKKILKRSEVILVSSSNYIQTSDFLFGYKDKIQIIPFGIDLSRFAFRNEKKIEEIKTKYPGPLILFVGKLRYYKGLNYLIESVKDLDGKILIIGDGALKNDLEEKIKINNLYDKIFLTGEVPEDELSSYYQAADIFVLPSSHKSEAFGISILEAMACGLPVISTELGTGTSFVNLHNKTGLVIPPRDSVALSKSINYLLQNKSLRDEFGKEGRERVQKYFHKEVMVSRIKKLYIETLKS